MAQQRYLRNAPTTEAIVDSRVSLPKEFRPEAFAELKTTPSEPLARYLVHKRGYFSAENRRVTRRAFMPSPEDNETSVFRIHGLRDSQIWVIGKAHVAEPLKLTF